MDEEFHECLDRARREGHLPDFEPGRPFRHQKTTTRVIMTSLTLPYATSALEDDFPGSDLQDAKGAHIASLDAYCHYAGAPPGHVENGRWQGGAPLWWHSRLGLDEVASMPRSPQWRRSEASWCVRCAECPPAPGCQPYCSPSCQRAHWRIEHREVYPPAGWRGDSPGPSRKVGERKAGARSACADRCE